jgi:hypothetical protein
MAKKYENEDVDVDVDVDANVDVGKLEKYCKYKVVCFIFDFILKLASMIILH